MVIKKEKSKSWFIITGFLLFIMGGALIGYKLYQNYNLDTLEKDAIKEFYKEEEKIENDTTDEPQEVKKEVKSNNKINYIALLKIPKINLERGLVDRNSYLNNINYNVETLKDSSMPDEYHGNVMLAAHSGNARISYFRNLYKLSLNDEIFIIYNGKTYTYKVVNVYDIEKTGTAQIIRNKNTNIITLVTCRHNTNNQIIVIGELSTIS